MGSWQYDDSDIERLRMIKTLNDIGFTDDEIERYMQLLMKGKTSEKEREKMPDEKRSVTLDEIHFKQKQLDRLDDLRYELKQK